jgi:hypothetical protein
MALVAGLERHPHVHAALDAAGIDAPARPAYLSVCAGSANTPSPPATRPPHPAARRRPCPLGTPQRHGPGAGEDRAPSGPGLRREPTRRDAAPRWWAATDVAHSPL